MRDADRPVYSIGAVAKMLSIAPATLRSWEDRYALVVPHRSAGGHRLYSRTQVDHLRFVQERLAEGVHASDAHRLLGERLGTPASGDASAPLPGPAGDRPLILVAEQDRHAAAFAEHFLRAEGFEVVQVFDAGEAAAQFAATRPVLAVVELMISGGVGADLCRSFKATGDVPIIVVSSLAAPDEVAAAGADAFLSKPLDPSVLVSTVKHLLGSSVSPQSAPAGGANR